MAITSDLVHEQSTTTGTGDFTLVNVSGKQSFNSAFGTGISCYYYISNQSAAEWEFGTGALSSSSVLARSGVIGSSNSNAAVSFSAGTKDVTSDIPSSRQLDTSAALTIGFAATADNDGTQSSGTYTPTYVGGNLKRIVNGGAFTLAAPSASGDYLIVIQITNNASAGAVTLSGFSKTDGDPFTTTSGDDFFAFITKINGFTSLLVQALQ